jgi:toxin CcdB
MPQWDVYENPSPRQRALFPYVVVLQSDLISALGTRLVAPLALRLSTQPGMTSRLTPTLDVNGQAMVLVTHESAPVELRILKQPVASVRSQSHRIVAAIDAVVSGV